MTTNSKKNRRHVIVGAGSAGLNAARTIRARGCADEVVLVSAERPYSRMVLPYVLQGRITEARTITATPDELEALGVEARLGERAARLDTASRRLHLEGGDELEFDTLLIATGSSPHPPPVQGAALGRGFWTAEDCRELGRGLAAGTRVTLVGAGFIGFTLLEPLLARGAEITVVEEEPRVLPRMMDQDGADMAARWLERRGVRVLTSRRLEQITAENDDGPRRLHLDGGQTLEADKVVLATGIRPNLDWLEGSGVRVEQGVVVDSRLQSSVEGVFAAGDVAQVSSGTGESRVMATEPAARDQGRVAGANMAGAEAVYRASPLMNIVSLGGLEAASFGHWQDQVPGSPPASSETIIHSRPGEFSYRRYSLREGRLAGALFLAPSAETWSTNDLGMIGGLVASGVDISEWVGFLKRRPLEINKPFLACGALPELLPRTVLPGT